jgi:hypothetical protein
MGKPFNGSTGKDIMMHFVAIGAAPEDQLKKRGCADGPSTVHATEANKVPVFTQPQHQMIDYQQNNEMSILGQQRARSESGHAGHGLRGKKVIPKPSCLWRHQNRNAHLIKIKDVYLRRDDLCLDRIRIA